ncbi:cd7 antigen-like [Cololabis saira]|uniref:cd7 antigen-like n=1 Tax=Cololabis saira TaxID=129043 RepID=UPI002AD431F4|nr:cd7 antigen-like [Cololabis saira]
MMAGMQNPALLCALGILLILQTESVHGEVQAPEGTQVRFLERAQGQSVVFPCRVPPRSPPTVGFSLQRGWLRPGQIIFKYTGSDFTATGDSSRFQVRGDPQEHAVNVTVTGLGPADTDRYFCEFVWEKQDSEDQRIKAETEFFLLVHPDAAGPLELELVRPCAGGSVVLPCSAPAGESASVEGVVLKRQRGRAPVEVVYHSQGGSSPSRFPAHRVQLSSVPGPRGFTYNLTLTRLQPEDAALYSCQLLLAGRNDDGGAGLGRRALVVSVQGGCSGGSSYPTLLYVLSAAVAVLLLLLALLGLRLLRRGKPQAGSKPAAPIYEEMVGVKGRKLPSHLADDADASEYKNYQLRKSCPGNHYESPSGALGPRSDPL